jgi:hypothetical protein
MSFDEQGFFSAEMDRFRATFANYPSASHGLILPII